MEIMIPHHVLNGFFSPAEMPQKVKNRKIMMKYYRCIPKPELKQISQYDKFVSLR
jgi:hypothetical protein